MIREPNCNKRQCIHFIGIKQTNNIEKTERPICAAFPDGIPNEIAYGTIKHLVKSPKQQNDIIYKQK